MASAASYSEFFALLWGLNLAYGPFVCRVLRVVLRIFGGCAPREWLSLGFDTQACSVWNRVMQCLTGHARGFLWAESSTEAAARLPAWDMLWKKVWAVVGGSVHDDQLGVLWLMLDFASNARRHASGGC